MAEKKYLVDIEVDGDVKGDSFIKDGGASTEFLKADGSVDTNTYAQPTTIYSVATEAAMVALSTNQGDIVVRTDEDKSYMRNSSSGAGTELISSPNFSSVAYPWNYGAWSGASLTTDGTTGTAEITGTSGYPKVLHEITTTIGDTYRVKISVHTNSNDLEVVAKDSSFTYINGSGNINNSTSTDYEFVFDATSTTTNIELALGGQGGFVSGTSSTGDEYDFTEVSVKDDSGMSKYTHFASL